jgi:hypothetical protein
VVAKAVQVRVAFTMNSDDDGHPIESAFVKLKAMSLEQKLLYFATHVGSFSVEIAPPQTLGITRVVDRR